MAVTHQCLADDVERDAVLQGDARHNSGVLRGGITVRAGLRVADENFSKPTVAKPTESPDIVQPVALEGASLASATIREAHPHGAASPLVPAAIEMRAARFRWLDFCSW